MKELYLHVGTPKTGTSAIQRFCADNSAILEREGISYRKMPFRYRDASAVRNGRFLMGPVTDDEGNRDEEEEKIRYTKGLELVLEQFKTCDKVILSDESLWLYVHLDNGEALRKLCEFGEAHGFVVKIIVYLRRQDEFISSLWRQKVKEGRPLGEYRDYGKDGHVRKRCSYCKTLTVFRDVVGRENITVRRFERNKFVGGSILPDFLDIFGLKLTDEYVMDNEVMNLSTNNDYTNIQRILNQLSPHPNVICTNQSKYFADIALRLSEKDGEYSILMDEAQTEQFMSTYMNGNHKIAKEYFGEDGDLFTAKQKDLPVWSSDSQHFQESIIKYFGQALLDQQGRMEAMQGRIKELEASQNELKLALEQMRTELHLDYVQKGWIRRQISRIGRFARRIVNHFKR